MSSWYMSVILSLGLILGLGACRQGETSPLEGEQAEAQQPIGSNLGGGPLETLQESTPTQERRTCTVNRWDVSAVFAPGDAIVVDGDPVDWTESAQVSMDQIGDTPGLEPRADLTGFYAMTGGDTLVFRLDTAEPPTLTDPSISYGVGLAAYAAPMPYGDVAYVQVGANTDPYVYSFADGSFVAHGEIEVSAGAVLEIRVPVSAVPSDAADPFLIYAVAGTNVMGTVDKVLDTGGGMILAPGSYFRCVEAVELMGGAVPLKGWTAATTSTQAFERFLAASFSVLPYVEAHYGWAYPPGHDLVIADYGADALPYWSANPILGFVLNGAPTDDLWSASIHEVAHLFNTPAASRAWLREGSSQSLYYRGERDFAGAAAGRALMVPRAAFIRDYAIEHGVDAIPALDVWGNDMLPDDDWDLWFVGYEASALVMHLLSLKYGEDTVPAVFRVLHDGCAREWGSGCNSQAFQVALEAEVGESVSWLFDSWVWGRRPFPPGLGPMDIIDSDGDGLLDIEERE